MSSESAPQYPDRLFPDVRLRFELPGTEAEAWELAPPLIKALDLAVAGQNLDAYTDAGIQIMELIHIGEFLRFGAELDAKALPFVDGTYGASWEQDWAIIEELVPAGKAAVRDRDYERLHNVENQLIISQHSLMQWAVAAGYSPVPPNERAG